MANETNQTTADTVVDQAVEPQKQNDGPTLDEILAENAKLKTSLADLEAGTDLGKLRDRVAHKESVIVDVQNKNRALVAEVASYKSVVETMVAELSDGVDQSWLDDIADLPVAKRLSLLRKLKTTQQRQQEPMAPKSRAPITTASATAGTIEADIARLRSNPSTTQRDWENLWTRHRAQK